MALIGKDNKMYAKIINNTIRYAPRNKGTVSNYNKNKELMLADGFKPVADYVLADDEYIESWKDNGDKIVPVITKIIQTEEEIKQARISELEAYLSSTDWYAIRESETGVDIPADVKQARADARAEISRLRTELEEID